MHQTVLVTADRADRARPPRPRARMTGPERREQLIAVGRKLFADKGFEATTVEEVARRPTSPSRSSTSTSAARRACTPSSSTARSRPCSSGIRRRSRSRQPRGPARAGRAGAARLHRERHRRLPHPRPGLPAPDSRRARSRACSATSRRQVEHMLARRVQARAARPQVGADPRPDARRHGGADRPVVAGPPQVQEGPGGRAPRQPRLERPVRAGPRRRGSSPSPTADRTHSSKRPISVVTFLGFRWGGWSPFHVSTSGVGDANDDGLDAPGAGLVQQRLTPASRAPHRRRPACAHVQLELRTRAARRRTVADADRHRTPTRQRTRTEIRAGSRPDTSRTVTVGATTTRLGRRGVVVGVGRRRVGAAGASPVARTARCLAVPEAWAAGSHGVTWGRGCPRRLRRRHCLRRRESLRSAARPAAPARRRAGSSRRPQWASELGRACP